MEIQWNILREELNKTVTGKCLSANSVNVAALYLVANHIARAKKLLISGEQLILPGAKDICLELFGKFADNKDGHAPHSHNTVKRRIGGMAEDVESQLIDRLRVSLWYTFQVKDVDNKTILLVYVWEIIKIICKKASCVPYICRQKRQERKYLRHWRTTCPLIQLALLQ